MPTPRADSTVLLSTLPIDISVTAIPRDVVARTRVVLEPQPRRVRDDPLPGAVDLAVLDETRVAVEAERDVDALTVLARQGGDSAVADRDVAAANVDSVHRRPEHAHVVEHDVVGEVDVDPVLAAETIVTLRTLTSSERMTIPPRTIAPSSPTSRCGRSRTSGPSCVPAGRRTTGGSVNQAMPRTAGERERRGGGESHAGATELASVLGVA